MRVLLDECLPKDFAKEIRGHAVKTVPQAGWRASRMANCFGLSPIQEGSRRF